MSGFANSFWNPEYCNFLGFDVLCQRMQDGKQMLKAFIEFLKQRAQAQEMYGKALIRLARTSGGRQEIGTLKQGWDALRSQTETIGAVHITTAHHLIDEAARMSVILAAQREQKKRTDEDVRKSQATLKVLCRKASECKKSSDNRQREKEQISHHCEQEENKSDGNSKEIEKLQKRQLQAEHLAAQADNMYRIALDSFENARIHWEHETEKACELFQILEEERINCLRNSMWTATNLGSSACVEEDLAHESVRKKLEGCSIADDITQFINMKKTGSYRPPPVHYDTYCNDSPIPRFHSSFKLNNLTLRLDDIPQLFSKSTNKSNTVAEDSISNRIYESIDDYTLKDDDPPSAYKVLYDYESSNDTELSLQCDDVVYVVSKDHADWWKVVTADGQKGLFPSNYLEVVRVSGVI